MCIASRKRNLDGQPVVTDSVYFMRNPACSNYGNTQGAPAPKKIDHLLQVNPLAASMYLLALMSACCAHVHAHIRLLSTAPLPVMGSVRAF